MTTRGAAKKSKNKYAPVQRQRLMLHLGVFVEVVFWLKLKGVIEVQTTIIHPVVSCSDRKQVEGMIAALESVRKDTYNVIGSLSFWGGSWMKADSIMRQKRFTPERYYVGDKPIPSKIFEWTVSDTAKNILAQQEAAKTAVIKRSYQAFPVKKKESQESLTGEQKALNQKNVATRKQWCAALVDQSFLSIPRLHRWVRQEYKRGHCRQNRQIVYQGQGYKCKRINRSTVKVEIQSLTPRKPITLTVRTNRIITGQIRVIRNDAGNLEIHNLETLYNRDYCALINRLPELGVDRGYTEVLATSEGEMLGDGFGKQLSRKTDRITRIGQRKNKLWSLANVRYKEKDPAKSQRIIQNNLGNKTELKRRVKDNAYVESLVNAAVKTATQQSQHIIYEDLTAQFQEFKKLSRKALRERASLAGSGSRHQRRSRNRLQKWQKGTVVERLQVWSERNCARLTAVNASYTSQVDSLTGTLLGSRKGDCFIRFTGDVLHSDTNAANNIRNRAHDPEVTRYMKSYEVQFVLLRRTAAFLKTLNLTLMDAIQLGWLDTKHILHKKFKELLQG